MNKIIAISLICFFSPLAALAQQYQDDENDNDKFIPHKVGIKVGIAPSWLNAPGMPNQRYQIGLQGGFYYRVNFNKKRLHLQTELSAAFRGAKFNNKETEYRRLGLFYMDLPVYLMYSFDDDHKRNILFGPMLSYLIRPSLYIGNELYPTFTNMPLKKFDFSLALAYLKSFDKIGLSAGFKYGLLNISKGSFETHPEPGAGGSHVVYLREVKPDLSSANTIKNLSVELSLFF